jgi:hypothetical protein
MLCLLVTNFPIFLSDMDAAMMVIQKQLPRTKKTAFLAIKLDSVAVLMARDTLEMRKRRRDAEVLAFVFINMFTSSKNQIFHLVICQKTEFGCCPNNKTVATGPDFEGCGVINHKDCKASHFKCCPDGNSAGKINFNMPLKIFNKCFLLPQLWARTLRVASQHARMPLLDAVPMASIQPMDTTKKAAVSTQHSDAALTTFWRPEDQLCKVINKNLSSKQGIAVMYKQLRK